MLLLSPQICNVIVKYPLTVQLAKERRVILKEMLEAQGVRMPDVYVPKGDRATATGRAVIRYAHCSHTLVLRHLFGNVSGIRL